MATAEDYELLWNITGPEGKEGKEGPQGLPASETLPADDAMAAYVGTTGTSATKRALLKNFATILTPERFGAVGDGVTNDGPALNAMIAAMTDGCRIQGKTGAVYRQTLGMTITGKHGWSWVGGKILYDDASPGTSGNSSGFNIIGCNEFLLDDIALDVVNQSAEQTGIRVANSIRGHLRRVRVTNARWIGIALAGTGWGVVLEDCSALRCCFGAHSTIPGTTIRGGFYSSQWSTTQEFIDKGGVWSAPSKYYDGIIINGDNWSVEGVTCDDNGQSGIYVNDARMGNVSGGNFTNNHNKGIDFGPVSNDDVVTQTVVTGNRVSGNKTGNISFVRVVNSVVSSNTVDVGNINTIGLGLHGGCENNLIVSNSVVSSHATAPAIYVDSQPANGTTAAKNNTFGLNFSRANVPDSVDWTNNQRVVAV